ncbi:MAG: cryptochrome/photolyase family protein [Stappia sp.]|uniref:cryptochrome/photolyase family protein n=1 Tax=Stappia sp. TaxID=1870903 RepID=UPI000C48BB78|nr:cryptochrome/photolyase family protein [Stappia sp.]MAA99240.1 cryptochrome/photolyase family protein [Stappia sp.]MBM19350.1 cryptochrome/photolyase family protein [Stappia sp.]
MPVDALALVTADQLSHDLSALDGLERASTVVLMVEVVEETDYVPHHRKKMAFLLSAMRHHAEDLERAGWSVDYVRLDAPGNTGSFGGEMARAIDRHAPKRIRFTHPGEWRVLEMARGWEERFGIPVEIPEDTRFICPTPDFSAWAKGRKVFRMEHFYREMRRKTGFLMEGDKPAGGRWNLDAENRKPADADLFMPRPLRIEPDRITREVLDMVAKRFPDRFGDLEPFSFPVTRTDALRALDHFTETALARFGDYQDAMLSGEPFLYHSLLSPCLNAGLLNPLEVCRAVENAYRAGNAQLNAAEGFIRQIIGWREYVRGIYWLRMPDYARENALQADRPLPWFYWSGETRMACVSACVRQTKAEAYAHHIQRLMVTGNFALLAGISPSELHEWYLAVYADAFEWVELPNTLGMSQFADGGLLGSKPYAASGNYIGRMSDYCGNCAYDVKEKTGETACPFNPLYWDFLIRNRDRLKDNPRLAQPYRTWERMSDDRRRDTLSAARRVLARLDEGTL